MKKKNFINEVHKLQKIAGILKENEADSPEPIQLGDYGKVLKRFFFGYDVDNIKKVEAYLLKNYKINFKPENFFGREVENPDAVINVQYGEEVMSGLDVLSPELLKDPTFIQLVKNCAGEGSFNEDDYSEDDYS